MKVYIAGPMTGYVEHNFPAFERAADHLRAKGYEVVNPAELDDPNATHEELAQVPHWWYMRRDIELLLGCDLIYLLPGWLHSKGACLEARVAEGVGIDRLEDADTETWRTFEGEPETEDASIIAPGRHYQICQPVQGDGYGNEWCEHGEQVSHANTTEADLDEPQITVTKISYPSPCDDGDCECDDTTLDEPLAEWERELLRPTAADEGYRPGDQFPNVGYVRRLLGCEINGVSDFCLPRYEHGGDGRGSE